ncbi:MULTISPECIES: helix-turn-helix domain-containing protein [Clostridium]|uniref:helix-turn-helix domain-containing protein n=1 Tax=Clostridium TaxID=1485 RepID=UPI000826C44D|nr:MULTISPECIES: helix-turn-helix transcriptional regulator [Clostridium]PJI07245.1 tetratricopeptide repeat protein [Clostridium sp. CT7]
MGRSYEIITIGTKLKNLRQKYNVRQDDLTGGEITRNLISQIEHDKANLTKNAAEIILKNLNKICDKKHISVDESIEYLMEDEKSQATKILDKYIKELKDLTVYKDGSFVSKLNAAEKFLITWDFNDKKISIFELAGDYFCSINDFYKSSMYYEKAKSLINMDMSINNTIPILRKLSMVYFYMGKYEDDIKCCDFSINHFNNMDEEYYCIFLYNSALCYINLKQYDLALERFNKIEPILEKIDMNKYYDVLIQKAVCFADLKQYKKSLNLYYKVIDFIKENNPEKYIIILINLSDIYIDLSDYDKARENLDLMLKNRKYLNEDFVYLPEVYSEIGKLYKKLNEYENSEEYYLQALKYTKKSMRYYLEYDILSKLVDIYTCTNNHEKVLDTMNEFFILSGKEGKINSSIKYKLIEFYLNTEDIQALKEMYNFCKKFG